MDGQHRLCALRKWYEDKEQVLEPDESRTLIPAIFLLIHPSAGFLSPTSKPLRSIAREVFTDLNKNAKKVDEAREIILDDRDLKALCARSLVSTDTCESPEGVLPLSLVRWQEANNRFDQQYYLNSLLNLHQLVDIVLNLKDPEDPLDKCDVLDFIASIGASLGGPDRDLNDGQKGLKEYYEQNYLGEDKDPFRPFLHLPEAYRSCAIEAFKKEHKPYVVKALTEFYPYARLLEYAKAESLVDGFFSKYLSQPAGHRSLLKKQFEREDPHWYDVRIGRHMAAIESIKRQDGMDTWAFKTIFQKALIRMLRVVCFNFRADAKRLGTVDDVIRVLNKLYTDRKLFKIEAPLPGHEYLLWSFLAINAVNRKIRVTKKVEDCIMSLLLLAYYANRKYERDVAEGRETLTNPKDLLRYFSSETSGTERPLVLWPGAKSAVEVLLKTLAENAGVWTRLPEGEKKKDKALRTARERLTAVLKETCVAFSPPDGVAEPVADVEVE